MATDARQATPELPSEGRDVEQLRSDYLRQRATAPAVSLNTEMKLRNAMVNGQPEAARIALAEGRERFNLEGRVIRDMPVDEFRAFHKEATAGNHVQAQKLLDAAVRDYGKPGNVIEAVFEHERRKSPEQSAEPTQQLAGERVAAPAARDTAKDAGTEALRVTLLQRHDSDPENTNWASSQRKDRDRKAAEREAIEHMTPEQLRDLQAARVQGPESAKKVLDTALENLRGLVDTNKGVRAVPPLEERFNVTQHLLSKDYAFRGENGKIAFTERPLSMRSTVDNPAAVKAMVDRAAERGWQTIRVSGSPEFQRQTWVAATALGIKTVGYEPTKGDRETAKAERERIATERAPASARSTPSNPAPQQEQRRPFGAAVRERQVLAALEKAFKEGKVPANLREQLKDRVLTESSRRISQGQRVGVKVYDPAAPRAVPKVPEFAPQRSGVRERSR